MMMIMIEVAGNNDDVDDFKFKIQSNLNGSNSLGTMKICSRYGLIEPLRVIVLEFNDSSTLVGHSVSSPREKKRDSRGDKREGQRRKMKMNEIEETEE